MTARTTHDILIYLDGSHEEEDVYQDLLDYHALLKPGGRIFGDDWVRRTPKIGPGAKL